ncbi:MULTISPECIES: DUF1404 domain-containing protein [Acidianus]|uniref:DUF1404 domain-containing protein n=1 Tax=Candidatus Acidianus copahuensis TaxID=1160895 RepID=A0A031LQ29_9CREN|nr:MULTISPECIES: DUF1404 domain-containing protein [Acidianus]EZQ04933.1 hypothetical protein CM19_08185 [Candidatus Acidianus copahuensis]NON63361.1 DUF1404 domain-containing protein [Acidianus sp. RZ1]
MHTNFRQISIKSLILPVVFVVTFVNPYVESLMFSNPIPYMLDHYALYAAGAIIGYKFFKTNFPEFILGLVPAVFWHIPLFFDLGAAFIQYRALAEITLFLGGLLAGGYISSMKLSYKLLWLAIYMLADTILSIFFILGYPQYTHTDYPFLSYTTQYLPVTGIAMFIVMNAVLVYALINIMKNASIF